MVNDPGQAIGEKVSEGVDPWQALTGLSDRVKRLEGRLGAKDTPQVVPPEVAAERARILGSLLVNAGLALSRVSEFQEYAGAITTSLSAVIADTLDDAHAAPDNDETEEDECEDG